MTHYWVATQKGLTQKRGSKTEQMIATTNFALHNLWSINDVVAEIRHLQLYYVYSCFLEKSVLQKADNTNLFLEPITTFFLATASMTDRMVGPVSPQQFSNGILNFGSQCITVSPSIYYFCYYESIRSIIKSPLRRKQYWQNHGC